MVSRVIQASLSYVIYLDNLIVVSWLKKHIQIVQVLIFKFLSAYIVVYAKDIQIDGTKKFMKIIYPHLLSCTSREEDKNKNLPIVTFLQL